MGASPTATVAAQSASIVSSRTNVNVDLAAEQTAVANIAAARADLEQRKLDFDRALALYNDKLIAKQDFDAKKAAYDSSVATLAQRQAASPAHPDAARFRMDSPEVLAGFAELKDDIAAAAARRACSWFSETTASALPCSVARMRRR